MAFKNNQIRKLYNNYGSEKIIYSIKNTNLKINIFDFKIFFFIFLIDLGSILDLLNSGSLIGFIIVMSLSIIVYCTIQKTLYFDDNNNLILENKLKKKKIIDISKYPRIYIRYKESYSLDRNIQWYELHIEQNNIDIVLDIDFFNVTKIESFLDNLQTKELDEVSETEWELSENDKEKTFSSYMKFLNTKGKIVGVKDTTISTTLKRNFGKPILYLLCLLFVFIAYWAIISFPDAHKYREYTVPVLLIALDLIIAFGIVKQYEYSAIRISYPSENLIRINRYLLDYKNSDIRLDIKGSRTPQTYEKYEYTMLILGLNRKCSISLNGINERRLSVLFDNLIFDNLSE